VTVERTYSVAEVGDLLGKSADWVAEQCRQGRLPHLRVGQSRRFTAAHVEEIVTALELRPRPVSPPLAGVAPRSLRHHRRSRGREEAS